MQGATLDDLAALVTIREAALTSKSRASLPDSDFIFPEGREYPYDTENRARNALSRGAQNESGARLATIKRKVKSRYPKIEVTDVREDQRGHMDPSLDGDFPMEPRGDGVGTEDLEAGGATITGPLTAARVKSANALLGVGE